MDFIAFLITQCLNALSQAALLFFLGCGWEGSAPHSNSAFCDGFMGGMGTRS